ncbi:hydrogenase 4 subunit B [Shewanella eurypsychrophilus]|uniref:Hydrogenase 4 subunit B n=2 Tax=Shewanella eurypsychrophilus TaxID=2593656 RepID=A0ABX6V4D1_9GAMM|nr:hydrogenase 4 subunit B [Shewanella sp. YLB-09]QFU22224.1 hydrogenase 4 subunit B [Shewanella sp. YLB-09]QPG57510.1 hydrogenase 4 subunit B [Shewanella eurypsychrophilus]
MMSLDFLLLAILLYVAAAVSSLLCYKQESLAIKLSGGLGALAGLAGLASALPILLSGEVIVKQIYSPFNFSDFIIRLDGLSAFMLLVISLLVVATAIYSLSYMKEYLGKGAWAMGFFMNTFIASMVALVVCDNAFYFIVFFEMMSLASYFLVISEQNEKAVKAGLQYFLIAHAGSVLIMIAFYILYRETGSLNFADFANAELTSYQASTVFLLAFFGFGAKAGVITLHGWLPQAHPAAPSHASALMSGVMVKIGVFGIIKVSIDFLGAEIAWWGYLVLAFGCVSSVLGVLYALAEHDIKRLLAYHTVENVGIILIGVGIAMIGMANEMPVLATLGMLGALYHLLNHAVFKGLLFLGAGSVIYRIHTKDMEKMGGLAKLMPLTAIAFLIGTMAISALPPLNGFVSEWFIYQSLLAMSKEGGMAMQVAAPIAVVMLAITGALACMCFVKVFGICFTGAARSEQATKATEVPMTMIFGTASLAILCIVLGIGAPWVAPIISGIASALVDAQPVTVTQGIALIPSEPTQAILSTPVIAFTLLALLIVPVAILALFKGPKMPSRNGGDPWACGYGYEEKMSVSAGGFTQPLRSMFAPLYTMRKRLDPAPLLAKSLAATANGAAWLEPQLDNKVILPIVRFVKWIGKSIQWFQYGDFRAYCLYIVVALLVLLFIPINLGVS